jgi:hypothetical protein
MYKKKDRSSDDDENSWIRCDDCHRWVMSKCDEELDDLSLYDDSNPNHLHYSCPKCRAEEYEIFGKYPDYEIIAKGSNETHTNYSRRGKSYGRMSSY